MICIAGKNEIAVYGVKLLLEKGISRDEIVAVINKNDKGIHGWQPSFRKFCCDQKIRIIDLSDLYDLDNLVLISLEYDQIIRTQKFRSKRLYNIHFSLLPAYKGMFTSIMPILNGEQYSGVTLHKIDDGIDTGEIIDQMRFDLVFQKTGLELYGDFIYHSKKILAKNMNELINNIKPESYKQPIQGASYYAKNSIDFDKIIIDFRKTSYEVCNFINAFSFRPYQLVKFNGNNICKATTTDDRSYEKPGFIIREDFFCFEIATIDYNIQLLKDRLVEILKASENNDLQNIMTFYEKGFSFKEKNENGWDSLIVACYNNAFETVNYLITNNLCDINSTNNNGTSAIMYAMTNASRTNDLRCLTLLIENGARLEHKDYEDNDVFYYANLYKNNKVIQFLSNLV